MIRGFLLFDHGIHLPRPNRALGNPLFDKGDLLFRQRILIVWHAKLRIRISEHFYNKAFIGLANLDARNATVSASDQGATAIDAHARLLLVRTVTLDAASFENRQDLRFEIDRSVGGSAYNRRENEV